MSDFDLLEKDKDYLDMLIETKMINHVGSGPVDPAPKEKETKSPVEDGTGQGTKQASTGHPNVIPPIEYLKKELSKESLEYALEMCGGDHGDDEEKVTKKKVSKEDISHALGSFSIEVREAELSGQANAAAADAGDQSFDMTPISMDQIKEPGGDKDKGDEGEGSAVGEQMMAARGSTADKIAARQSGATSRPIAGSPADRAAKASAFEKQKAAWNQAAASTAAQPEQVQKSRQPVPTAPATRPLTPGGMLPKPTPGTRPLTPGGMLPKPTQGKRSLRTRI